MPAIKSTAARTAETLSELTGETSGPATLCWPMIPKRMLIQSSFEAGEAP